MNEVVFLIIILSAYILPVFIVVNSKRTQGQRKKRLANRRYYIFVAWACNVFYYCAKAWSQKKKEEKIVIILF